MALYAKDPGSKFTPASAGEHRGVCVDVVDLGLVDDGFGEKPKVKLVWQLEETSPDTGQPRTVSRRFTRSLHPMAALRQTLDAWRGKPFTEPELAEGFDLERLIGVPGQVQVSHKLVDDGRTFANVVAVGPAPRGVAPLTARAYTREKDRGTPTAPVESDDAIPF